MYTVRTDLALERHARLGQVPPSLPGLAIEQYATAVGDG